MFSLTAKKEVGRTRQLGNDHPIEYDCIFLFLLIALGPFFLNLGSNVHDCLGVNLRICQDGFRSENELGEKAIGNLTSAMYILAPTGERVRGGD